MFANYVMVYRHVVDRSSQRTKFGVRVSRGSNIMTYYNLELVNIISILGL